MFGSTLLFIQEYIADNVLNMLNTHVKYMQDKGKLIKALNVPAELNGHYFVSHAFELDSSKLLAQEVFGTFCT
ncbi:MAG: hypothetical protein JKY19_08195 [Alcanivoracaceae bacterium]|nr:hypothetical protein [Alcanivoracaceae bacterium]